MACGYTTNCTRIADENIDTTQLPDDLCNHIVPCFDAADHNGQNHVHRLQQWKDTGAIGVSKVNLLSIFNQEYKISPWDRHTRQRILKTQTLLRSMQHAITKIARLVGFTHRVYFNRVFSRRAVMSLNEFRSGFPPAW